MRITVVLSSGRMCNYEDVEKIEESRTHLYIYWNKILKIPRKHVEGMNVYP